MIRIVFSFIGRPWRMVVVVACLIAVTVPAMPNRMVSAQVDVPGGVDARQAGDPDRSPGELTRSPSADTFESGSPGSLVEPEIADAMPDLSDSDVVGGQGDGSAGLYAIEEAFPGRHGPRVRVRIDGEAGVREIEAEIVDGYLVAEGDMIVGRTDDYQDTAGSIDPSRGDGDLDDRLRDVATGGKSPRITAVVQRSESYRWPGGVVPYTIDGAFSRQMVSRIESAMQHWQSCTPVRFVPRDGETDYVRFEARGQGCSAAVGRQGRQQAISLGPECTAGAIVHEIGHAVGFFHEQSRGDRDRYLTVWWDNITSGMEYNFERAESGLDVGSYDFNSIMHYDSYAFSWNGLPTLTRRDGSLISTQRNGLSSGDIAAAWAMYGASTSSSIGSIRVDRGCGSRYRYGEETPVRVTVNQAGDYAVTIQSSSGSQTLVSRAYLVPGVQYSVVSEYGTPYRAGSPGWREIELVQLNSGRSASCEFSITW